MGENSKRNEAVVVLPIIPLRGMTILPGMPIHFDINRKKSIRALEQAMRRDNLLFLLTQRDASIETPTKEQLYSVGTIATVKQITKLSNHIIRILVEGKSRGILKQTNEKEKDFLEGEIEAQTEESLSDDPAQTEAILRLTKELFAAYAVHYPKLDKNAVKRYAMINEPGSLLDQIAMNLPIDYQKKQEVLEAISVNERFETLCVYLQNETLVAGVREDLAKRIRDKIENNQKEYLLREQLRYIKEELGEEGAFSDAEQFEQNLETLLADEEVKEKIKKEIIRFKHLAGSSSESAVERAYIETLLELPWKRATQDNESIKRAKEILDREHYGLEQVKERILEFLAVRCLTQKGKSPIICLVGPPGTGKTSIARSVAEALDKKYIRICLGGVRDEAEIRGHRKTYVGAMPGRIAVGLKQAGVRNPLMLLDEIDKVSNDYKGDVFSALLEVLDSEQNVRFRDHYVELPLDLSEVLFIATANSTQTIPRPLLDRMEIIEVNGYTENEKFHIAKEHLLKKQMKQNGITSKLMTIQDGALKRMIAAYTKEAGVRGLERKIGDVCRKVAREILEEREQVQQPDSRNSFKRISVTAKNLEHYLGKPKYRIKKAAKNAQTGVVRGLAWTSVGGETLQIEVNCMPGKGEIVLTGQMGDVMKESAKIALSYVRSIGSEHGVESVVFQENDFHIHIPEGAVPKDGPSAGITMATALFSAVTGKPIRADLAMTGEVTLRGNVLPIGGLKEKLLAAAAADIKEVLVPEENLADVDELSDEIKGDLKISYVKSMTEVLKIAFVPL